MHDIAKIIVHFFNSISGVVYVGLFGSMAKETAHAKSDVDIAVLFERKQVPEVMSLIQMGEQVAQLIGKEVDLICLNHCSPIVGLQVYKNGKTLLLKNSKAYGDYLAILFSDYAELKMIREPMEKNILKRKFYDRS